MQDMAPPALDQNLCIEIKNLPVRLWWKLMETAQARGVPLSYLIFQTLVEAVGYQGEEEPYDLVVREIKKSLGG
jgi:hypothetical protein